MFVFVRSLYPSLCMPVAVYPDCGKQEEACDKTEKQINAPVETPVLPLSLLSLSFR